MEKNFKNYIINLSSKLSNNNLQVYYGANNNDLSNSKGCHIKNTDQISKIGIYLKDAINFNILIVIRL